MRTARATALAGALMMLMSACSLPMVPGPGGPDVTSQDVITIHRSAAGMFGFFGSGSTSVAEDSITQRFSIPNGVEIYSYTEELETQDRMQIEEATEKYLVWESTLSQEQQILCTDMPNTDVEISGSFSHESSVQDCKDESPLRALKQTVRNAQGPLAAQLAVPTEDWTIEIRPWVEDEPYGGGPDEEAPVERYDLLAAEHEVGMGILAQNTPDGWGERLAQPRGVEHQQLGWDTTGVVLTEVNDFLLGQGQMGCGDPSGEIRVIQQRNPALTWTYRLCPGEHSEELAQTLRGL